MPADFEQKLRAEAAKKHLTGEKADAYVYGTLRKTGWKPEREKEMRSGSILERKKPKSQ